MAIIETCDTQEAYVLKIVPQYKVQTIDDELSAQLSNGQFDGNYFLVMDKPSGEQVYYCSAGSLHPSHGGGVVNSIRRAPSGRTVQAVVMGIKA